MIAYEESQVDLFKTTKILYWCEAESRGLPDGDPWLTYTMAPRSGGGIFTRVFLLLYLNCL